MLRLGILLSMGAGPALAHSSEVPHDHGAGWALALVALVGLGLAAAHFRRSS